MEPLNIALDAVLVVMGIAMAMIASRIPMGGAIGKTVRSVVWGAIVLGVAHVAETMLDHVFHLPTDLNEFIHRLVILLGFALLLLGLRSLAQSLAAMRKR